LHYYTCCYALSFRCFFNLFMVCKTLLFSASQKLRLGVMFSFTLSVVVIAVVAVVVVAVVAAVCCKLLLQAVVCCCFMCFHLRLARKLSCTFQFKFISRTNCNIFVRFHFQNSKLHFQNSFFNYNERSLKHFLKHLFSFNKTLITL